ncbi:hypothetical protein [Sedimenticola selenatireducens]|uniref:Uncharacterized protein n=1 Tax=Sedimenticola selenatireducens TaxID=191960 RepID=A0A557SCG8_9GAMM|nr:hypothetical protein [Sedimenticola selenatireducens]TVO75107.1 hypothetical protein FHP88_08830 [Sedimenticola selenatireducens]TVT67038.1 MAG: hypothetical protein FHK78_01525 [Sedimenticola selenatireducens]
MTGITDQVGPLVQLIAYADHEVKYTSDGSGKKHIAHWAAEEIERLQQENDSLKKALTDLMPIMRGWEPDYSTGEERQKWARAQALLSA